MKCELCNREVERIEFHHFFPGKKRRKNEDGIYVCNTCGDQIHILFSNQELRDLYNSIEKILGSPRFNDYLKWIKDKPDKKYTMKLKKKK